MSKLLEGKVALVTGASSGIGEATALCLAEAGATVAISARRAERLAGLVQQIEALGGKALAIPGDMAVEADARNAVARTVAAFGRIDILVNSAGIMQAGGIENCDTETYRQVMDINLMGTVYTCAEAVPHMLAQGVGDIVTISSLAGRKGGPMTSAYSASKHAVNFMTDGMRQELGGRNIRVATLMPGATETEVAGGIKDPNWRTAIAAHVSKDGAVKPRDIGETIVFMMAMPRRANISEITVRPTIDTTA
ncbi:NADP-dependent 3-hydroxy acid dehydrogenase YdfG [Novosphingobium chloroacetimidivorans]|uniref:NADP-dependent 3-hydroxy acid dehydrogenase YdfG n=1 Tax=Novosphingobium chloroacetimidivorans TaxID=1428314 RepID=A0A7W7NYC5_9SPHN|nr:SDR family NAD(P)-dependent oxidoreductase [Novosphingobium chloroacetimidivorans]MBB4860090.1 NADP-dependent 3-hydroxy acid dehydrogenase YdfG [Novosphingobium chloroacetimidivorans]